ncbi:methyltransferase domain-containing protein [Spongiivirga sp. MCCC 1A20706]|uniref:methyltransferase domain-containing protein n=1 Tax=Spongiivirga sp. MCCC 1A20706 TaxID=3160963 RepID=UPI003977A503
MISIKKRIDAEEVLDNFDLNGDELAQTLNEIANVNKALGGNNITIQAVQRLLKSVDTGSKITIADIGCGNGDMLRTLSSKLNNRNIAYVGIDANPNAIKIAEDLSQSDENISYKTTNVFEKEFEYIKYDIALCTLTLHHFTDLEILQLVQLMTRNAKFGLIINDLQRSRLAYVLFKLYSWVFQLGNISKEDGLTSILRGFKKNELIAFSEKIKPKQYTIQWKWAFRYLWIIKT